MASPAATPAPQAAAPKPATYPAYRWVVAWGVLLGMLWLLSKTEIGHVAIFYGLILILLFLLATNYANFAAALAPLSNL
jgi:hypothetical protein